MATITKARIRKHVEEAKEGRYDKEVADLIAADEKDKKIGENTIELLVPTTETSDRGRYAGQEVDAVAKYVRYFQYSAKKAGRTARIEAQENQGDGTTLLAFYLAPIIERKPRNGGADVPESAKTGTLPLVVS